MKKMIRKGRLNGEAGMIQTLENIGAVISHYCRSFPSLWQDLDSGSKTNRNVVKALAKVDKEFGREEGKEGWQKDGKELGRSCVIVGRSWPQRLACHPWQARGGGLRCSMMSL